MRAKKKKPELKLVIDNGMPTGQVFVETEERCEFSELFPSQCAHCKGIKLADWETLPKVNIYRDN